jgi:hypothetical protein
MGTENDDFCLRTTAKYYNGKEPYYLNIEYVHNSFVLIFCLRTNELNMKRLYRFIQFQDC